MFLRSRSFELKISASRLLTVFSASFAEFEVSVSPFAFESCFRIVLDSANFLSLESSNAFVRSNWLLDLPALIDSLRTRIASLNLWDFLNFSDSWIVNRMASSLDGGSKNSLLLRLFLSFFLLENEKIDKTFSKNIGFLMLRVMLFCNYCIIGSHQ